MLTQVEKGRTFRALHERHRAFIIPNPWDVGSAQILAGLGFQALATTSSGYAFAQGRKDGANDVSFNESLEYAGSIARVTDLPVTADFEDCYAKTPDGIADVVRLAAEAGLAGISIEDRNPDGPEPIRAYDDAVARVAAAVEAARRFDIVLTARADGMGKDVYDLGEAIRRLRKFEELGAEVVYAPGPRDLVSLRRICESVRAPVNHVLGQGVSGLSFKQIADAGVRRVSLGGSLARAAGGALVQIGRGIAAGDFATLDAAPGWSAMRNSVARKGR